MRRLLTAAVIAVLAVVGLVVSPQPAEAAQGWRTIYGWPRGSVFMVCQYTENGGYGPVWHTRLVLAHHPAESGVHLRASFTIHRMTSSGWRVLNRTELATDSVGQWDVRDTYGSQIGGQYGGRWYADRWSVGWGDETGGAGDAGRNPFTAITHC
jgi:hypothetical protein